MFYYYIYRMEKAKLKFLSIILLLSSGFLNGQVVLPGRVQAYVKDRKAINTIQIECIDTVRLKSNNKWVFDASSKQYYGVHKDGKSYLYLKEKLWSGQYVEKLIYDTAVYMMGKWGVDKLEEWQVLADFADCSYQFYKDTFYYKANDEMRMLNDSVFEYASKSEWEGLSYQVNIQYTFDKRNNLKLVRYFQIAGGTDTAIRITKYNYVNKQNSVDMAVWNKIRLRYEFALKQKKIKRVEVSLLQKFENKKVPYTFEKLAIRNQSLSLDSIIRFGKITILYKWFEGCVPCAQIRPYIDTIYRANKEKGLNVIGVNNVNSKPFVDTINCSYQNYFCTKTLDNKLEINGSPTLLIFNNQNQLLARLNGYTQVSVEDLKTYLAELLKE